MLGGDATVHEYHSGVPGSFAALEQALGKARALELTAVATTVVTRSNFRSLEPIAQWLSRAGAGAWCLGWPSAAGGAGSQFDRVVPRLGLALPFALRALDRARREGLPTFIAGAPVCALGPYARFSLAAPERDFGDKCQGCAAKATCPGVDTRYLRRFGEEELKAVAPVERAPAPVSALFVGTGELFDNQPAEVPQPPVAVRLQLKELGKVRPASAEVKTGVPKKSGESLKEIFPALFGEAPEKPPVKPG